jgi:hypothetical protein
MKKFSDWFSKRHKEVISESMLDIDSEIASISEKLLNNFNLPYESEDGWHYQNVIHCPKPPIVIQWNSGDEGIEFSIMVSGKNYKQIVEPLNKFIILVRNKVIENAIRTAIVDALKLDGKRFKLSPTDKLDPGLN